MREQRKQASEGGSGTVAPEAVGSETHKTPDTHDHLVALDSLRGIAIIWVVMLHVTAHWSSQVGPVEFLGIDVLDHLRFPGVPLFYLLSGYLLTWTEDKRFKRGNYSLRSYAKRRVFRLVPAYYVAIVVALLLWPRDFAVADVALHAFFLHGFSPEYARTMIPAMWSLTPEVIFYCLLPFFVLIFRSARQRIVIFAVLYAVSLPAQVYVARNVMERVRIPYGEPDWFSFWAGFPTTLLYLFVAGMLLRMLVERLHAKPPWLSYAAFALFVLSFAELEGFGVGTLLASALPANAKQVAAVVLSDLAIIGFFASAVLGAPLLRRLLGWKPLSFVGLVSYSMFLFHQTILLFAAEWVLRSGWLANFAESGSLAMVVAFFAFVLLFFVIVTAISWLGFRFIESPFLRMKPK